MLVPKSPPYAQYSLPFSSFTKIPCRFCTQQPAKGVASEITLAVVFGQIVERKTFEAMVAKFDRFVHRMEAICQRHGEKRISEWMDNQDVCRMLNISPRTLQTLRDNGTLAYSQINHKTYYRPEDVQRIISVVEDRRKEAKFKGRTI